MKLDSAFNNEKSFLHSWYKITKGFGEFFKEESKELKINPAECMFLSLIYYKDGISQREIANKLIVSEANITKTFKKLEEKKMVFKTIDEENNARRNLHLTQKGEDTFEKCILIFDKYDSILFEGLTDEQKDKMETQVKQIGDKSISIVNR